MADFDVAGARQAGYSEEDIARHLAGSRNFDVDSALKSGYKPLEIIDHLMSTSSNQVDKPVGVQAGHIVPGRTPAERQHWIHNNPQWAKALGEGPQAIATGPNAMKLPDIHPAGDAAAFAASPVTGLLSAPVGVADWAVSGFHNPPSGGFLSENPLSQAYGNALAAVATPAGREPGTTEVGPIHKVLANHDLRNQVLSKIPGLKWIPEVLDVIKKASEPTGAGWSDVPPQWRPNAPTPPPGMDAFGNPIPQPIVGVRPTIPPPIRIRTPLDIPEPIPSTGRLPSGKQIPDLNVEPKGARPVPPVAAQPQTSPTQPAGVMITPPPGAPPRYGDIASEGGRLQGHMAFTKDYKLAEALKAANVTPEKWMAMSADEQNAAAKAAGFKPFGKGGKLGRPADAGIKDVFEALSHVWGR